MAKVKGPGNEKAKATKAKDTATSPYYKTMRAGGAAAHISKMEMSDYFGNKKGNNKRGETSGEHVSRMKKRETTNRKNMGLPKK